MLFISFDLLFSFPYWVAFPTSTLGLIAICYYWWGCSLDNNNNNNTGEYGQWRPWRFCTFSLRELHSALSSAERTAPGKDDIIYDILKHLPTKAKDFLLNIFNRIGRQECFPKAGRFPSSSQSVSRERMHWMHLVIDQLP